MTNSASSNYEVHEDDYVNRNRLSMEAIHDLRSIVVRMNSSGFLDDCLKAYVNERKFVIGVSLQHLNVETLSRSSCKRLEWGVLESKIKFWIKAAEIWWSATRSFSYLHRWHTVLTMVSHLFPLETDNCLPVDLCARQHSFVRSSLSPSLLD
ncbi:hypothetical protein L1987_04209 [Smallanthus sonchifolius]|uniref:Uncharacterized protein n=1 Tax=Smallanthus sonchifolius TaxID=185202 RepID=A0ACB9KCR7_9ASTR|nr:hypothetical protein L1987_04209 [Smallanthus sonchifolius]